MHEIEKDVEFPEAHEAWGTGQAWRRMYPWGEMEVGDSILVDGESTDTCKASNAASQYGRRNGIKFTARKQGNGKVRIWRVA